MMVEKVRTEIIRIPRVMQSTGIELRRKQKSIGLVPTMGALHAGHMSLIKASKRDNDMTIASIFVNPLQFGPSEDLSKYPRDPDGDMARLRDAGADIVFMPDAEGMYAKGFTTNIKIGGELTNKLCGGFRPGHFDGVATVVAKLFNLTLPVRAYFGQKDYQQTLIIKRLVIDLNMPVEIIICPTVREHDGLAMSSRNKYLSEDERKAASVIYRALNAAKDSISSGEQDMNAVNDKMQSILKSEPMVGEVQYAGAFDADTLDALSEFKGRCVLAVALKIGQTRLIDNMLAP